MRRIVVIGMSGCGKSTIAGHLARRLRMAHLQLDLLHYDSNSAVDDALALRGKLAAAVAGDTWVFDGDCGEAREVVWPLADSVIWLDYAMWRVVWQMGCRMIKLKARRLLLGDWPLQRHGMQPLAWIASRTSPYRWTVRMHAEYREDSQAALRLPEHAHLRVVRFQSPRDTRIWLRKLTCLRRPEATRCEDALNRRPSTAPSILTSAPPSA